MLQVVVRKLAKDLWYKYFRMTDGTFPMTKYAFLEKLIEKTQIISIKINYIVPT
jgi:hypothetical protein